MASLPRKTVTTRVIKVLISTGSSTAGIETEIDVENGAGCNNGRDVGSSARAGTESDAGCELGSLTIHRIFRGRVKTLVNSIATLSLCFLQASECYYRTGP